MINGWMGPFNEFPREMGFPSRGKKNRVVYSLKEFLEKVNRYNGHCTVFTSLYSFERINSDGKADYDSARIRHIFFDLDNGQSFESIKKLHNYFIENGLRHMMFFSGGGFHMYLAVKYPNYLKNKKASIFNAVVEICDKLGLKIGINEDYDIDAHAVGNLAQLVRVPNTYNLKRKRFCIPLSHLDLLSSPECIRDLAKKQRICLDIYGKNYFDLKPYDREPVIKIDFPAGTFDGEVGLDKIDIEKFPPCIKSLLSKRLLRHRERFFIISYCKEIGMPIKDTILLLRKYLTPKTFHHCIRQECQPMWVYRRGDLSFPSCRRLQIEGYCPKENCGMRK